MGIKGGRIGRDHAQVAASPVFGSRVSAEALLNSLPSVQEPTATLRQIRDGWEKFAAGVASEAERWVRPFIIDRWRECLRNSVAPSLPRAPTAIHPEELHEILATNQLAVVGAEVLGDFAHVVDGTGHIIVIADEKCRILAGTGNREVAAAVERVNFSPGGLWAEDAVGPNGVGTPIVVGVPGFVFGPEHFCEGWQPWICYGSPIHDPGTRRILGGVDVTAPAVAFDRNTLAFTLSLARCIERGLTLGAVRKRHALLKEYADALRRWPNDGIVLLDETERIVEISPRGVDIIGRDLRLLLGQQLSVVMPELVGSLGRMWASGGSIEAAVERSTKPFRAHCSPVLMDTSVVGSLLIVSGVGSPRPPSGPERSRYGAATGARLVKFSDILGASETFSSAIRLARIAARSEKPVLLIGESGTGKELFAQAIHSEGPRARGPFVAVNCAALPRELVEAELFGHVSGAFTGASRTGAPGKFEQAHGGTLFLDEIDSMPLELQGKLLRALEAKVISRLGGHSLVPVDVRVVTATNRELPELMKAGHFRLDLYYRLNVLSVRCPALRERPDDVAPLVRYFIERECAQAGRPVLAISPDLEKLLREYPWPGNVRELRNLCARWAETACSDVLTPDDLPSDMRPVSKLVGPSSEKGSSLKEAELGWILSAVRECDGNLTKAARRLGISRATLYARLKRGNCSGDLVKGRRPNDGRT